MHPSEAPVTAPRPLHAPTATQTQTPAASDLSPLPTPTPRPGWAFPIQSEAEPAEASLAVITVGAVEPRVPDDVDALLTRHEVAVRHRMHAEDDAEHVQRVLFNWITNPKVDVVLAIGDAGVTSKASTVDVVERLINRRMDGFGEMLRSLAFDAIGSPAMRMRAVAGLASSTFIFAIPGMPEVVDLAMTRLILPELPSLDWRPVA